MKSKQYSPNETVAWRNLEALAQDSTKTTIADLFKSETDRAEKMSVEIGGIVLDFSKNLVSQDVLSELMALVDESNLETQEWNIEYKQGTYTYDKLKKSVEGAGFGIERVWLNGELIIDNRKKKK